MTQQKEFQVFRYKQGQTSPTYQTFKVSVGARTTVLDALQEIRRTQDKTLMLRHSCLHASCGTCGVRVNGREGLGCVTNVMELGTEIVMVEPLENAPVLGDLVVEMDNFYGRYSPADMPYIRHSEFLEKADLPEGIAQFNRFENCLECGLCVSACPVMGGDSSYLGPAALAAAWRVVEEPRSSNAKAALQWVDHEHGCWQCHVAYECTEACPSNVDPAGGIMSLRRELTKQKVKGWFGRG